MYKIVNRLSQYLAQEQECYNTDTVALDEEADLVCMEMYLV